MSVETHLDALIDIKEKAIKKIINDKTVMGLVFDDPNIDMDGDEVYNVRQTTIFDHSYTDDTVQTANTMIFVESCMIKRPTESVANWALYVQVVCSHKAVGLDHTKFIGFKGNRRDNIVRHVDVLLNGARDFGIGRMYLSSVQPVTNIPSGFSSIQLIYETDEYAVNRRAI